MTSRERIKTIIAGEKPDRCGFWLGKPHDDTWPILFDYFGTNDEEELRQKLNDDFRWINPTYVSYIHPEEKPIFDTQPKSTDLSAAGVFSDSPEGWRKMVYLLLLTRAVTTDHLCYIHK